jgi:uncharacterized protein (DUF433 family)
MSVATTTEVVPLHTDTDGIIRVSQTRVTLDTIVGAFNDGATAEEIAQHYPVVPLADVYSVIAHYLRRDNDIEAYLKHRQTQAEQVRQENERRFDSEGMRARLMARRPNPMV